MESNWGDSKTPAEKRQKGDEQLDNTNGENVKKSFFQATPDTAHADGLAFTLFLDVGPSAIFVLWKHCINVKQ